ncbi:Protein of unknown function [Andreprevotia lacus DSM 23236]|uniref:Lysozyme inhibitor LprI-like N-terminal domain-containing protein n=1 Tax=Andreprevotia lacus DSM 23236 TaxID=1121001 RepID=A0A1W1Y013_9NEIS|nr:lysozyme inhibitor LprI family protein [Andreprevotia lacus]SMC29131.1 Protein of unknown function [Andreprevotia lacus DSM 23236]
MHQAPALDLPRRRTRHAAPGWHAAARRALAGLLLGLALLPVHAMDCSRASSASEKRICADPKLLQLDGELNTAYTQAMAKVPAQYQALFKQRQLAWLQMRDTTEGKDALVEALAERIATLKQPVRSINRLSFLFLDHGNTPPILLTSLPGTAGYNAWALRQIRVAIKDDHGNVHGNCKPHDTECDFTTVRHEATLYFASPELLSIGTAAVYDTRGAAHPGWEIIAFNFWMSRTGQVKASDIFRGQHFLKAIRAKFETDNEWTEQMKAAAADPVHWTIGDHALSVGGDAMDFGMGRGGFSVEVPWRNFGNDLTPEFRRALAAAKGDVASGW